MSSYESKNWQQQKMKILAENKRLSISFTMRIETKLICLKWQNVQNLNCPNWKLKQRKCWPERPAFAQPSPSFPPEIWPYYGVWRWGGWLEGDDHRRRKETIFMADIEASGRYNSQTKSLSRADHSTLLGILFGIFRPMNEILLLFSDKICESGWPQSARLYCCRELSHCRNNKSKQISWTD